MSAWHQLLPMEEVVQTTGGDPSYPVSQSMTSAAEMQREAGEDRR